MYRKLLFFILLAVSALMFLNLGDRFVWSDEAETAFFAKNILRIGYPSTKGEANILWVNAQGEEFYDIYGFPRINGYQVEVRPWLPLYLVAIFFYLFGSSFFVLRFPFALAGVLTILFLYMLVKKWTNNTRLAVLSSFFLAVFVPFYLYSRNGRYYAFASLFFLLVLISYARLLKKERFGVLFLILSGMLLFYTLPAAFLGAYLAVLAHFFIFEFNPETLLKSLAPATAILFFIDLPWLLFVNYSSMSDFNLITSLFSLVHLFAYILFYIFPFVFVLGLPFLLFKKSSFRPFFWLLILSIVFSIFGAMLQPWGSQIPFRYITFLFPLFMVLIAGIILQLAAVSKFIAFIAVFFLVFTNFLYIFPFKLAEDLLLDNIASTDAKPFVEDNLKIRYFLRDFIYEITHHYSTPNENIINFIKSNGGKSTDILLTNYDLNVMLYASGMRLYQKGIVDKKPDWIVLRKPASYPEPEIYNYVKQFINLEYEKFVLNTSDYRYQLDGPHPRTHRFRELSQPIVSLQYPHEADFIEIYKLKNDA